MENSKINIQEYKEQTTKNDLAHNLCDSCTNIGCEFQSGIVRTKCTFYMPPNIESDNCGNFVVQEPITKNDLAVDCTPNTISFKEAMDILKITAEDIENAEDLEYSIEPLNCPMNEDI